MIIELRFLEKAISEKNYISFKYESKSYKKEKALKLENKNEKNILRTQNGDFDFAKISKLQILKDRFWLFKSFRFISLYNK